MRNGIGPHKLGVSKENRVADVKTMAQQTNAKKGDNSYKPTSLGGFGGPRYVAQSAKKAVEAVGNAARKADANISSRAQKSSSKPSAEAGTMQDFMNRGPIGFVRNLNRNK